MVNKYVPTILTTLFLLCFKSTPLLKGKEKLKLYPYLKPCQYLNYGTVYEMGELIDKNNVNNKQSTKQ